MLHQILTIVVITALVMLSPGPDMVIVMRNVHVGGRPAGLRTALGMVVGSLVHIAYCVAGIGWLLSHSILAFGLLKYAGAAYLIYLGVSSLRASAVSLKSSIGMTAKSPSPWFLQGFTTNVLNPKATLFYLGVFTTVITPDTSMRATAVLIAVMLTVSVSFWLLFVQTIGTSFVRRVLNRGQKTVNRLFGILLVGLGVRVALLDR